MPATFADGIFPVSGVQSAFFSIGGVITEFTVPQATSTVAYQINSSNQVCGLFSDGSSRPPRLLPG